jgi:hypothetical protein
VLGVPAKCWGTSMTDTSRAHARLFLDLAPLGSRASVAKKTVLDLGPGRTCSACGSSVPSRSTRGALHSFLEIDGGSCLAFFKVPGRPFDFKRQDTLDLHIALGVDPDVFDSMLRKARNEEVEVRGQIDLHARSEWLRD